MEVNTVAVIVLSLVFMSNAQELGFRENVFHPAADVQINQIKWKKISLSEVVANEDQGLKETFKAFHKKDFEISHLKSRLSYDIKDFLNNSDSENFDKENLEACSNELEIWLSDVEKGELYALQMLDSWGRQEGGILEGNVRWPGHYHECIDAKGPEVSGKYCQAFYGFQYNPRPFGIPIDVMKGICFPSICSESSTRLLHRTYFSMNDTRHIPLRYVSCRDKPRWSSLDTIGVSIIAILLLLALAGLVTDLVKRAENKSSLTDERSDKHSTSYSMPVKMILCFSPLSNAEKLLDSNQRPGAIPVMDGIRFISTTWVVLGHTLQMMFYTMDNPFQARKRMRNDASFQVVINGTVSVDTFFLLSGLLVAYLGMKHLHRTKGSMNIPLMYLQRFLRLTPVYAFMILFSIGLYKFFGAGPVWKDYADWMYDACKDNWWTNLVYINNVYPEDNGCYPVGWYLANDTQFYILAPFLLLLLYRWRVVGILLTFFLVIGGMVTNGVLTSLNDIRPTTIGVIAQMDYRARFIYLVPLNYTYDNKFSNDIYHTPWARINVYLIGMLTGYLLFITKRRIKMYKAVVVIGWLAAAGCALGIIYGLYGYIETMTFMATDLAALYNAVNRPVWGICVAWVIVACSSGYGGPITTFLNWKVFVPLSRLTYTAYLVHILVLYWYAASQEKPLHFSATNFVYIFLGTLIITFGWAFIVSLFIEWPFLGLLKVIFSPFTTPKAEIQRFKGAQQSTEVDKSNPEKQLSNFHSSKDFVPEIKGNCYNNGGYVKEKIALDRL